MRVFVTGASGFIGEAVVQELLSAGHQVLGLARNDASAKKLTQWGAEVHRGELSDTESLAAGARACDGVIHLAFIHDFSQFAANAETDRVAAAAMADALAGTGKPLVVTSGTAVLSLGGRTSTEQDTAAQPEDGGHVRAKSELILSAADKGVRVSVVRLSPTVHDKGDHGFVPALINIARQTGVVGIIDDGENQWPAVHRRDAARLFRLAVEKAEPGSILHGVGEQGIPMREIAATIGKNLNLPVRSLSKEEAAAHFGMMAHFVGINAPSSNTITRESLGWNPENIGLLEDMEKNYFSEAAADFRNS